MLMGNIHSGNKTFAKLVRMVDGGVEQEVAPNVANDLMHFDDPGGVAGGLYRYGFDVGIKTHELPRPVGANLIPSMDVAALQTVRPFDSRIHEGDYSLNVTGVEVAVSRAKGLVLRRFGFRNHGELYSGWSGAMRQMLGRLR